MVHSVSVSVSGGGGAGTAPITPTSLSESLQCTRSPPAGLFSEEGGTGGPGQRRKGCCVPRLLGRLAALVKLNQ